MRDLIERYARAWEDNDRAAWLATFADDAVQEDPIGTGLRHGSAEIGGFWDQAMAGYNSLTITPRQIFVLGREAAMVWRITAERDDGWLIFDGVDVFTLNDVPLITSVRAYWESEGRRLLPRAEAIYHLAIAEHWPPPGDAYRRSTIDKSLDEEGFIHCSRHDQLEATAARFYAGRDDVVLLTIDPDAVHSDIKVEGGFPHIYGPLPRHAVIRATPF